MPIDEMTTVLEPHPMPNFIETPFVKDITERSLAYIAAGFSSPSPWDFRNGQDHHGHARSQ